jgi:taurine transport system permease protein
VKLLRVLPFVLLLVAWWLATTVLHAVPPIKLPAPDAVWSYARDSWYGGTLWASIWGSISRFLYGLGAGAVIAIPLGLGLASSTSMSETFLPLVKFFQAIAGVTWIPLAVLWFGISSSAAIFIIFNTTFFIILYAVMTGVRAISPTLGQSVKTLGGSYGSQLRDVLIPGSLPHVLTGLRVAVGYGWRALIAAEVIASGRGLGVMIWDGQQQLNTAQIFTGLLLIGVISFAIDRLILRPVERNTIQRWGLSTRSD